MHYIISITCFASALAFDLLEAHRAQLHGSHSLISIRTEMAHTAAANLLQFTSVARHTDGVICPPPRLTYSVVSYTKIASSAPRRYCSPRQFPSHATGHFPATRRHLAPVTPYAANAVIIKATAAHEGAMHAAALTRHTAALSRHLMGLRCHINIFTTRVSLRRATASDAAADDCRLSFTHFRAIYGLRSRCLCHASLHDVNVRGDARPDDVRVIEDR